MELNGVLTEKIRVDNGVNTIAKKPVHSKGFAVNRWTIDRNAVARNKLKEKLLERKTYEE